MPNKKRSVKKYSFKPVINVHNDEKMKCCHHGGACGGGVYFLGFVGAAVFYLQQSTTFWTGVLGLLKALVWPAFLVYKLLG
ncbi:Uncharacterised protein [uncultured archaeon]|nr:Uncharacterised protein [uncultured archaeon]